jgi:CheY-like chemotaxis protein
MIATALSSSLCNGTEPLAMALTDPAHESSADNDSAEPHAGPSIIVVDDELVILELIRDIFHEEGFTVLTASTGAAALQLIKQQPVALVITDMMMPNLTGLELAQRLRSDPATATIPIILMSAAMPSGVSDIFADVIHKPFPLEVIVQVVRRTLSAV